MAADGLLREQSSADQSPLLRRSETCESSRSHDLGCQLGKPHLAKAVSWDEIIYTNIHLAQRTMPSAARNSNGIGWSADAHSFGPAGIAHGVNSLLKT
ncbi:MAG: hypothetical protein ABJB10_01905 [Mesorhizobium sp.]